MNVGPDLPSSAPLELRTRGGGCPPSPSSFRDCLDLTATAGVQLVDGTAPADKAVPVDGSALQYALVSANQAVPVDGVAPQDALVSVDQSTPVNKVAHGVAPQDAVFSANQAMHVDGVAPQHDLGSPSPVNNGPDLMRNNQLDLVDQVEEGVTTIKLGSRVPPKHKKYAYGQRRQKQSRTFNNFTAWNVLRQEEGKLPVANPPISKPQSNYNRLAPSKLVRAIKSRDAQLVKEVRWRQHAEKVDVSSHGALATQTSGDLHHEKVASRLVIQSVQNNADKQIQRLEDKLKDSKTMLKKVTREYESKLKNVEEDSNEKLKDSKTMLEDVTREYESKLKNLEEDSNTVLNAVNKFYEAAMKDVEMAAIRKTKEKMNVSKTALNRVIKDVE